MYKLKEAVGQRRSGSFLILKKRRKIMRVERFKMERPELVKEGEEVEITEHFSPGSWYYIIEPTIAMSGCYKTKDRILSNKGVVKAVEENERGFYLLVEIEE
jgi:hypothetical protein